MSDGGNGANGNGFRQWMPLWLFLAAQTAGGIWWAATINAKLDKAMEKAIEVDGAQDLLRLQFQTLDKAFAVFEAKGGVIVIDGDPQKRGRSALTRP